MNGSFKETLLRDLKDKQFRDAYVTEQIKTGIAYQIRALRENRRWTQADFAVSAGKRQSVISRLENPDYGRVSLQTLLALASALDVALLVKFVSFSELIRQTTDLSPDALAARGFEQDDFGLRPSIGASVRTPEPIERVVIPFPGQASLLSREEPLRQEHPSASVRNAPVAPSIVSAFSLQQDHRAVSGRAAVSG